MATMSKRAGFDPARVVRVRIGADKAAGTFQFGSGYLIAPEFVLTAGHVLSLVEGTLPVAGAECEVQPLGTTIESWQPGEVVWPGEGKCDVALVKVAHFGASLPPARFGRLEGLQPVKWRAIGFRSLHVTIPDARRRMRGARVPRIRAIGGKLGLRSNHAKRVRRRRRKRLGGLVGSGGVQRRRAGGPGGQGSRRLRVQPDCDEDRNGCG